MICNKKRLDYFLIWGHGLKYTKEILHQLRNTSWINIECLFDYHPKNLGKFVKLVYSHDYAPYFHLKAKTKYLHKTVNKVLIIVVNNKNPDTEYFGDGDFRHLECKKVKSLKEEIRNNYNPLNSNGERSEHHVIHASDNEEQTLSLLSLIGKAELIYDLKRKSSWMKLPYYIDHLDFQLKKVRLREILCSVLVGSKEKYQVVRTSIQDSPHYQSIYKDDFTIYEEYINKFLGGPLNSDYSVDSYKKLITNFNYLKLPYENNYIIVKQLKNKYVIQDGLHRASILLSQKKQEAVVGVI